MWVELALITAGIWETSREDVKWKLVVKSYPLDAALKSNFEDYVVSCGGLPGCCNIDMCFLSTYLCGIPKEIYYIVIAILFCKLNNLQRQKQQMNKIIIIIFSCFTT